MNISLGSPQNSSQGPQGDRDQEKQFLQGRIEHSFETYYEMFQVAKDLHQRNLDRFLLDSKELRDTFVGAAAFVATIVIGVVALTPDSSLQKNPIVQVIETYSAVILGGAILFAVTFFIGMNLWRYYRAKDLNNMLGAVINGIALLNALKEHINTKSISFEQIQPEQLYLYWQLIRVAVGAGRLPLFDAFKAASKRRLYWTQKESYKRLAMFQRVEMDINYDVYSSHKNRFFEEREFLKEALPAIVPFVFRYNKVKGITEDPLMDFVGEYIDKRYSGLKPEELLNL